MALEYFYEQSVDIAVIETGLGGRLDSTNIIHPVISIITNIGYDHMNILGDTLEKIAFEKAGIIKPGIPVIIGETLEETKPVFTKQALQNSAPLVFAEKTFTVQSTSLFIEKLEVTVLDTASNTPSRYELDLNGLYQQRNLCTVLTALRELRKKGYVLEEEKVKKALIIVKQTTGLFGRWDVIHQKPMIVLDVAHNSDGIQQMVQQIKLCSFNKLHIIIGMVKDKDIDSILKLLPVTASYYFTRAQIPRASPEKELKTKALAYQLEGNDYKDVNTALQQAIKDADQEDLVVICGSVFLVGEVDLSHL
jgi:dihydrofolate synthase/folylpolyglutamate synthase